MFCVIALVALFFFFVFHDFTHYLIYLLILVVCAQAAMIFGAIKGRGWRSQRVSPSDNMITYSII